MINRTMLAVVSLFIMTACNNAVAIDTPEKQPETKPVTRAECLAMETKEEKIACLKKLTAQGKTELARKKARLETTQENIARIEKENEALLNEFEKGVLAEE